MSAVSRWSDLAPRIISGAVLAVAGLILVLLGGIWFQLLAAVSGGIMVWELSRMIAPGRNADALGLGLLALVVLLLARWLGPWTLIPALLPAIVGYVRMPRDRLLFAVFALAIAVAAYGLVAFREGYGAVWLVWLFLVVVATDVAGYFAGRSIGGPKFWPRVSPKKTWAGTSAGWIAAAIVGAIFLIFTDAGGDLVWISAFVALASQMGDIAESAVKRRCGVKDSSNLIPGHGGLFDRFDGVLGAALAMLLVALVVDVPVLGG